MPKRVIDGEGVWRSDKLSQVEPPRVRAEYANLVPLSLANGVFEANPRRVWSAVYSFNRPDISIEDVENFLAEFERVRMLFRWNDPTTEKIWGFWIGIDKPGRLPGESRKGKHEAVGPTPPADALRMFLDSNGQPTESIEQPLADQRSTNGGIGFGFGTGSGSGSGVNPLSEQKGCSDEETPPSSKKLQKEPSREAVKLAALLKSEILRNSPSFEITQLEERNWAAAADRMLRLDHRDPEKAAELIRWAQRDDFWSGNVLSMEKFRKQFNQLAVKAKGKANHIAAASAPLPADYRSESEKARAARAQ